MCCSAQCPHIGNWDHITSIFCFCIVVILFFLGHNLIRVQIHCASDLDYGEDFSQLQMQTTILESNAEPKGEDGAAV